MKSAQGLSGLWFSSVVIGATALLGAQAAIAAVQVTAVKLNNTEAGLEILLTTEGSDRPQVFSVNRGETWTADIVNTQLKLPEGGFRQENPATGISFVTVAPIDGNSIRITVQGQKGQTPVAQANRPTSDGLMFSLKSTDLTDPSLAKKPAAPAAKAPAGRMAAVPPARPSTTAQQLSQLPPKPTPNAQAIPVPPPDTKAAAQPSAVPSAVPSAQVARPAAPAPGASTVAQVPPPGPGQPLVPNPRVTVEGGNPVPPIPPLLPRAVPPPVGDISVGLVDASPQLIDLGTAVRVPRLVLRDAPAREVLSLLARSAGLNVVFTAGPAGQQGAQQQQQGAQQAVADEGPRITLDIENELVQNVFNYVLQVAGLDANRVGSTIFVGQRLPNSAQNLVVRSLRLNQVPITNALNYMVALGAESAVSRERLVTSVNAVPIQQITGGTAGASAITQTQTTTEQRVEVQRVDYQDSTPILRGLLVSGDERTNTITLVGTAKKIDVAIAQLKQIDVRRRQVVVNVRVIDVNLLAFDRFGTSFSLGIDGARIINTGGVAVVNFGRRAPASAGLDAALDPGSNFGLPSTTGGNVNFAPFGNFERAFFGQLQAAVTQGNAKILTDPSLVVQEGQTASVDLTQEVVTNIRQEISNSGGDNGIATLTVTVEKAAAGLTLPIRVDRIDDNGFISLSVAPLITRPERSVLIQLPGTGGSAGSSNAITLLSRRQVESGQVRLRDGQTLILSGIIEDQDRSTVTKVPILGDIPILGALFRRTERQNERREVIVLLTPRVLDDSQYSTYGYGYQPSPDAQRLIDQGNR